MSRSHRRRPETPQEFAIENVAFWTRAAQRYEFIARNDSMPGKRMWAAREARRAREIEASRREEMAR